jgi:hypothetical protein
MFARDTARDERETQIFVAVPNVNRLLPGDEWAVNIGHTVRY